MLELLDKIDKLVFLFINGKHSAFSDPAWQIVTNIPTWIPLYILLIFFIIKVFKRDSVFVIAGVLLVVLVCDQLTSGLMKPFFERLRPCHDPEIGHLVHIVKNCGGKYGFASGHSANSFGIAMFTWLTFRSYWKGTWLMFVWAFFVALSRIMVGVHYPGDILVGGLLGILFGWLIFKILDEVYFRVRLAPLIKN
jgi:undecaprenyl-diphosphatase